MLRLLRHTEAANSAVKSVDVALGRTREGYRLWYFLIGDTSRIVIPDPVDHPGRADRLWETTCFEAFVKGDGEGYCEFNFAPSGNWAAYAFNSYRDGMRETPAAITVYAETFENLLCVEARINADFASSTRLCLSAVVEEIDGSKSYWSLAHPDGPPDFHHDACFAVRLADIA